jgi:carboxylesterase
MTVYDGPNVDPFIFRGGGSGCLLIHGFLGTPHEMRGLGESLARHGITAVGIRLAGHGTTVAELRRTRWHDWWASAKEACQTLRQQCDSVFVCGLSMGGTLALHLAAHRSDISGVVAIAPAVRLADARLWLRNLRGLAGIAAKFNGVNDIQDPVARASHASYDRIPTRCLFSLLRLNRHVRDDLPEVQAPLLVMQARQDRVIPASSPAIVMARVSSAERQLVWLERGGHVATVDYDKLVVQERVAAFIAAHAA